MIRTQVELPDHLHAEVKRVARERGISMSEVVRRGLQHITTQVYPPLPRRAGVSSFGFGGVNVHLVIEEYVSEPRRAPYRAPGDRPAVILLSANALGLDHYDPVAIHGSVLPLEAVVASCNQLIAATYAERAAMPFMHPGRVEAIGAGALVWREVVTAVAEAVAASGRVLTTVTTSEHDILDGIALSIA